MPGDFAAVMSKLNSLGDHLDGTARRQMLEIMGKAAKQDAIDALVGDLGDQDMSHWWRGKPIQIGVRYTVSGDSVEVTPAPQSRGPWKVLEDGRTGGGSHDLVLVGRVRKDGSRRPRTRGRTSGATGGKGTWSAAEQLILDRSPDRIEPPIIDVMRRLFG